MKKLFKASFQDNLLNQIRLQQRKYKNLLKIICIYNICIANIFKLSDFETQMSLFIHLKLII